MIKLKKKPIIFFPVILCGGFGTRLWPLSRKSYPKQFVKIFNNISLLQRTVKHFNAVTEENLKIPEFIFVTNEEHRFILMNQIKEIGLKNYKIILEPSSRNTAPSATLASKYINLSYKDGKMLILPSDHLIKDTKKFINVIKKALLSITDKKFILFGIKPTSPNIHYGYIKYDNDKKLFPKTIINFIEKPNLIRAKRLFKKDNLLWNSGIFLMTSNTWLSAINKFRPKIYKAITLSMESYETDNKFIRPNSESYNLSPIESIDYSVIENLPESDFFLEAFKFNFLWSDLGNWNSLSDQMKKDKNNNYIFAEYLGYKSSDNIVYTSNKFIVTAGISNKVIIEDDDSIFIGNRNDEESLKEISKLQNVTKIQNNNYINKNKFHRPWGFYEDLNSGGLYKVKKIHVNQKSSLSLQSHKFRSEHWVVVEGIANVICGAKNFRLKQGESTFIKKNEKHRLLNLSSKPLIIIEVQFGEKIDENDILRFSDNYNRE